MSPRRTLEPDIELAYSLFSRLQKKTADGPGVTRASYSANENAAHALIQEAAAHMEFQTHTDHVGNLYITLAGRDRDAKPHLIGSHLDSVKCGGNYDGAAGVLAGLAVLAAYRRAGQIPHRDVTVMATRAEESMWFSCSYIGSRAALGLLQPKLLTEVKRIDTGQTLAHHIAACGFDVDALGHNKPYLLPKNLASFFEVHIEQGPVLFENKIPVGVVTGIRGNFRYRNAVCVGEYGHCGTVPRKSRRDSVSAVADFIGKMNASWEAAEKDGHDLAVTFGIVETDHNLHSVSKIAGQVKFGLDVRSQSPETLVHMGQVVREIATQVAQRWNVDIDMGYRSDAPPALMNLDLRTALIDGARRLGLPYLEMPSGAGHDAAMFAYAGVPTAMIFIRNEHGSHNPKETMEMNDFSRAAALLLETLEAIA
jgi:N-carbamoyl-L-amino-acid hydrolase